MSENNKLNRRQFNTQLSTTLAASCVVGAPSITGTLAAEPARRKFRLNYLLASSLYGRIYLGDILPVVAKTGATAIDLWPRVHGSQREQLDAIGEARLREMLAEYEISVGCLTRYDLAGPEQRERLHDEIRLAGRLECPTIVTAGQGPKGLVGGELKSAVKRFAEQLRPTLELAAENKVRIAIENHSNSLIDSVDSMRWLAESSPSAELAIAFAPYHLPQNAVMLGELIRDLGPSIAVFYAWEHGMGCMERLPKDQELMQLPGRGPLNFKPMLSALREIDFGGWTEIFMHPYPRGIPILETESAVSNEIAAAKQHLENLLIEIE